jgi:hypothetical protein
MQRLNGKYLALPVIYDIAMSFIDLTYKKLALTNTTADGYLYKLLNIDASWVINIDEDAFILSNNELLNLLDFMQKNEYDFCGMPDGGVVPIRGANPVAMNPYFNIFNIKKIRKSFHSYKNLYPHLILKSLCLLTTRRTMLREMLTTRRLTYISMAQISSCTLGDKLKQFTPHHLMRNKYEYVDYEPYYPFFYWLLKQGFRPLYLDARMWEDNICTMLHSYNSKPLLLHCWYAREWHSQQERYNLAIEYCKSARY